MKRWLLLSVLTYSVLYSQTSLSGISAFQDDSRSPSPDVASSKHATQPGEITIEEAANGIVEIRSGDRLFAKFAYKDFPKPIIYPLLAVGDIEVTRNYPMKDNVDGEARDHPHHKSIWMVHGDVNGHDFWSEKESIVCNSIEILNQSIIAHSSWIADGQTLCNETTRYSFAEQGKVRLIDVDTTICVGDQVDKVIFGDTKEGFFAIRTHPGLRLTNNPKEGVTTANGKALNSNGDTDKDLWGKSAAWVYYWGEINKSTVGIGVIDHKKNLRHPTTWHARDYGLIAANPFGLHHFQSKPEGTGDHIIDAANPMHLQYRVVISNGQLDASAMEEFAADFVEEKK